MLVLKDLVGLHRAVQLQLLHITGCGIDLDYSDIEWFALEMTRDHSVIFEIASKYCILDSFVDHDGYSISSEGFPLNAAKRSYLTSEVRGSGLECQAAMAQEWPRGATLHPRSVATAGRRHPVSEVRDSREKPPHA